MLERVRKSRTDALDYMQSMLRELRIMAQAERLDVIAYFVEMAYIETSDIIRGEHLRREKDKRDAA